MEETKTTIDAVMTDTEEVCSIVQDQTMTDSGEIKQETCGREEVKSVTQETDAQIGRISDDKNSDKIEQETCEKEVAESETDGQTESQAGKDSDELKQETCDNEELQSVTRGDVDEMKAAEICDNAEPSTSTDPEQNKGASVDPYAYLKRDEFTSEIFKIEIQNLPKRYGIGQLKKRLSSQKINPIKVKTPNNGNYAFVTFRCEEERENALKILEGHVWKGKTFKVKKAHPAADPLLKRKLEEATDAQGREKKPKLTDNAEDDLSIEDRLKNAVTPLWKIPYEEQLQTKQTTAIDFMKKLCKEAERNNYDLRRWLIEQRKKYNGSCCEMLPIKQSPVLEGYRNKCEFTIGQSQDGKERVVGFRLGSYKDGVWVAEPHTIDSLLSEPMKKVVQAVQQCISDSAWSSFNAVNHVGHWSMLTVRTTQAGEVMAVITFNNSQQLTQDNLDETKKSIVDYFTEGPGKESGITSFYFSPKQEGQKEATYEHLLGSKSIQEDLLGFNFRISPDAFFQVNTCAAEVLYSTIADWCQVTPETTILDVCCGTGTIGITMAKKAKRIVGIEMVQQATDDARANAKINDVKNTEYYCGKAEDVLPSLMNRCGGSDVIAVVDPPRSGLNYKVIQAIRRAEYLKRLVYVSCNPNGALLNLIDLLRAKSNRIRGRPFLPVKAVAVDLFPHTKHCELVILFERQEEQKA